MGSFTRVAQLSEVPPGRSLSVEVAGRSIALFNVGGTLHAIDGECTHAGAPLDEGEVEGGVLTCPWHAATFDLSNGKALTRPASIDLHCYRARVAGDGIEVELP